MCSGSCSYLTGVCLFSPTDGAFAVSGVFSPATPEDLDEFLLLEAADATNRKHWTVFEEGYRLVGLFTTPSWVMESCLSAELSTVRRKDFT